MSKEISFVITDCGDGSNGIEWITNQLVLERLQEAADNGNESYASGDGLQLRKLQFPADFDLDLWLEVNSISLTTLEDTEYLVENNDSDFL